MAVAITGGDLLLDAFLALLRQNGNDPKVVRDLLRHASQRMTEDVYDAPVSEEEEKMKANKKVVRLVSGAKKPSKGLASGGHSS